MAKITYVTCDDAVFEVEVEPGFSLMEGAVHNNVPGIDADCGGACACATCHVYIDESWLSKLLPREEMEEAMLEFANGPAPNSRLSCQIKVTDNLDGMIVRLPMSQG